MNSNVFVFLILSLKIYLSELTKSYMKKVSDFDTNYILFSGFTTFEELRIDCCQKYNLGHSDGFGLMIEFLPLYPIMIDKSYDTLGIIKSLIKILLKITLFLFSLTPLPLLYRYHPVTKGNMALQTVTAFCPTWLIVH